MFINFYSISSLLCRLLCRPVQAGVSLSIFERKKNSWVVYRLPMNVTKLRRLWLLDSNLCFDFIELLLQSIAVGTWLMRESTAFCVRFGCAWGSEEGHCGVWGWIGAGLATEGSWRFQVRYFISVTHLVTMESYSAREFGTHLHLFFFLSSVLVDGH